MMVGVVTVAGAAKVAGPSFDCGKAKAGKFVELKCRTEYVIRH